IGHVTKSGDIAGPRILEHIVDVVLYMEALCLSSSTRSRQVNGIHANRVDIIIYAEFGKLIQ
ncbi:hypothetical protein S83_063238, partial [Arachis hypogaea]